MNVRAGDTVEDGSKNRRLVIDVLPNSYLYSWEGEDYANGCHCWAVKSRSRKAGWKIFTDQPYKPYKEPATVTIYGETRKYDARELEAIIRDLKEVE